MAFDYNKYIKETLENAGFNPEELTEGQQHLILQPTEAPENFMCDGEISRTQAMQSWKFRMRNSGMTEALIRKAVKLNFRR